MTLLRSLADTSAEVAETSKRSEKIRALTGLLVELAPEEVAIAVAILSGEPRQGRVGVGWATIAGLDVAAADAPSLTILELDAGLTRIASTSGPGSTTARRALLVDLLARSTPPEQSLIRRLVLGELRQGALAGVMTDAVAKAATVPAARVRRAAMLAGDLAHVAEIALTQGSAGLDAVGLVVGRPVQPMLATTSPDVASAMHEIGGVASVEWKLDGARIQAHRHGGAVSLFTRNLNDVTARLPDIVAFVRSLPADTFVLDGEVMGFDDSERPGAFQDTMSAFGRQGGIAAAGLGLHFFDILRLDGADLVDRPLVERRRALAAVAGDATIPGILTDDPEEAVAFATEALARGHEGVLVKDAGSTYEAGRRGKSWRKVKPVLTLDLVVIGVEWGSGRRRGWLSNLHLGARDASVATPAFVMVGKTFKGLTDALLAWQTEQLLARRVAERGHVVDVRPELVVEIALDGVQRSTRYPGGVALRFARVKRYREDKSAAEADTIQSLQALLKQ